MYKLIGVFLMITFFLAAADLQAVEKDITRDQIPENMKWNLQDLYKSNEDWTAQKNALAASLNKFSELKGKLGTSADDLYKGLDYYFSVDKEFARLYAYAMMLSDQDTRESGALAMKQEISQLGTDFQTASSFIRPEILSIEQKKLDGFFKSEPKLKTFRQYISDIQRLKPHTLSPGEEKLIADAGIMAGSPDDIYSIFSNADFPYPTINLANGEEVYLDAAGYSLNRASNVREDRKKVFETFFSSLNKYNRTFGTQLYSQIKKDMFYKNARNYSSSLESALDPDKIPVAVYTGLINNTHKHLPTLHRYLKLRKRMLGVDELRYYDMYPSLVKEVDMKFTVEEAQKAIMEALKPLGSPYLATLDIAFNNRWIDMYPTTGKRSGAYSEGVSYDVHPYILMNYNGKYDDVSTLAHELGHTMHSYYSNKNQPYVDSQYPTFLAEVASTSNEALLIDYELQKIKDPEKRLSLLGSYLEGFRTTMFRQTMFAEFELKIHDMAEKGETLTGEVLSKVYLDLLKQYYGHDQGVTVIDDLYGIEWAYIPHFYYNFYVFQYATSFCASSALAEKMLTGGPEMRDRYLEFLSAGSSDYAIPILKKVGIDMTTSEPFDLAMQKMNRIMDEIENILDKQ